ncbi:LysR substrate-binding domain-containing protein [Gemmobacter sp.]|uniref:LysR substrate-binding domain-containing protein n=1 Tax=Gemmobacter sp. TaxID=1898957 RepID=UPI002AFE305D|nr:LysR substrate-binding domain-containing protein [Gemmobacter sp.]
MLAAGRCGPQDPGVLLPAAQAIRRCRSRWKAGRIPRFWPPCCGARPIWRSCPTFRPPLGFCRQRILWQEVVAIVAESHPLAAPDTVAPEELADQARVARPRGLSMQKAVDRAFARAGAGARPPAGRRYPRCGLRGGQPGDWRGFHVRADAVRRLAVAGRGPGAEDVVFALADDHDPLADMSFLAAADHAGALDRCAVA